MPLSDDALMCPATAVGQHLCSAAPLLAALMVLGLAMGGCSLVPGYQQPVTSVPEGWATPGTSSGPTVAVDPTWWRSFGDPELAALMDRALAGSFNLQAAVPRIDQAPATPQLAPPAHYPPLPPIRS